MKHRYTQNRPKKSTLIAGYHAVVKALQEGPALDRIYVQSALTGEEVESIKELAFTQGVPINKVPVEKLNNLNVPNHRGFVAVISKVRYHQLQDVISFAVEKGETPFFLMLEGITDIRNIGGIARTAHCCGVHALIIPEKGIGALNEDAISTSAGALEELPVCRVTSLVAAVEELHLNGISVLATEMKSGKPVYEQSLNVPVAIVMGSEDKGISPALLKACDDALHIPMPGGFESLNVSAATSMILYETMRQRLQNPS
jgi:23S rRNA (guanosine2251-2'-O)-methyltransferase